MLSESGLQSYLRREAKKRGILFYKLTASEAGFPDVMLVYRGQTVFVELKSPKGTGRLSARQIRIINQLESQGMEVYVEHTKEGCSEIITGLIEGRPAGGDHSAG